VKQECTNREQLTASAEQHNVKPTLEATVFEGFAYASANIDGIQIHAIKRGSRSTRVAAQASALGEAITWVASTLQVQCHLMWPSTAHNQT
jgi:hypothetical protein